MNINDLKQDDQIVFKLYSDIYKKKIYETGTVISANQEDHTVNVCWMEGYKNRNDIVAYGDMVAKYDKDGEYMRFGNISGPSVLLEFFENNRMKEENQIDDFHNKDQDYETEM